MKGTGVIVLRQENHHFFEHQSIQCAKAEARRLAESLGGTLVVYVPITVITPAPKTVEHAVVDEQLVADIERTVQFDDDLPF